MAEGGQGMNRRELFQALMVGPMAAKGGRLLHHSGGPLLSWDASKFPYSVSAERTDIAKLFRIPPVLVGIEGPYQAAEKKEMVFIEALKDAIIRWKGKPQKPHCSEKLNKNILYP